MLGLRQVKKKTEEEMKAMELYRMTKSDAGKVVGFTGIVTLEWVAPLWDG